MVDRNTSADCGTKSSPTQKTKAGLGTQMVAREYKGDWKPAYSGGIGTASGTTSDTDGDTDND